MQQREPPGVRTRRLCPSAARLGGCCSYDCHTHGTQQPRPREPGHGPSLWRALCAGDATVNLRDCVQRHRAAVAAAPGTAELSALGTALAAAESVCEGEAQSASGGADSGEVRGRGCALRRERRRARRWFRRFVRDARMRCSGVGCWLAAALRACVSGQRVVADAAKRGQSRPVGITRRQGRRRRA